MCASAIRAISVLLGERWKKMRSEERRVFTLQAKALADEQKRLNPDCWKRKRTNSVSTHMRLHSFTHCFVFLLHPASLSCRAVKEIKATEKKRGQLTEPVVYTHTHTRTHIRTLKKRAMHNRILRFSSIFVLSWSPWIPESCYSNAKKQKQTNSCPWWTPWAALNKHHFPFSCLSKVLLIKSWSAINHYFLIGISRGVKHRLFFEMLRDTRSVSCRGPDIFPKRWTDFSSNEQSSSLHVILTSMW